MNRWYGYYYLSPVPESEDSYNHIRAIPLAAVTNNAALMELLYEELNGKWIIHMEGSLEPYTLGCGIQ